MSKTDTPKVRKPVTITTAPRGPLALTGDQLKLLMAGCNISIQEFASIAEVNLDTLYAYTSGRRRVTEKVAATMFDVDRAVQRLADQWLNAIRTSSEPREVIQFDMGKHIGYRRRLREAAVARVLVHLDADRLYETIN